MSRTWKDTKVHRKRLNRSGQIPAYWKRLRRKQRRGKERTALRSGREPPIFKRCDEWDWW